MADVYSVAQHLPVQRRTPACASGPSILSHVPSNGQEHAHQTCSLLLPELLSPLSPAYLLPPTLKVASQRAASTAGRGKPATLTAAVQEETKHGPAEPGIGKARQQQQTGAQLFPHVETQILQMSVVKRVKRALCANMTN